MNEGANIIHTNKEFNIANYDIKYIKYNSYEYDFYYCYADGTITDFQKIKTNFRATSFIFDDLTRFNNIDSCHWSGIIDQKSYIDYCFNEGFRYASVLFGINRTLSVFDCLSEDLLNYINFFNNEIERVHKLKLFI
jgi:hypothetical protein